MLAGKKYSSHDMFITKGWVSKKKKDYEGAIVPNPSRPFIIFQVSKIDRLIVVLFF